jgi:hypothetical protein
VFDSYQDALDSPFGVYITSDGTCPGRPEIESAPEFQQNFTVGPAQTNVWWLAVGGMDYNLIGDTKNIAIGGLPSGTSGQSWYDFNVQLGLDGNFQSLQVEYNGTGGINTDNNQNGFNIVACNTANGNLSPTLNVLSPYASSWPTTWQTYYFGQPICLGWLPTGTMMDVASSTSITPYGPLGTITALQYNPTGPSINMQGTLVPGFTDLTIAVGNTYLYNGLGSSSGSFVTYGNQFIIEGAPLPCDDDALVFAGTDQNGNLLTSVVQVFNIPNLPECPP